MNERREYHQTRYLLKREQILAQHKKWRENHPEYYNNYFSENRQHLLEYQRKWRVQHPENRRAIVKRHTRTLKFKLSSERRRCRLRGAKDSFDIKFVKDFLKGRKTFRCFYCNQVKRITPRSCHLEHIIPLSRGGEHRASNITIACQNCNLSKADKLPNDFILVGQLLLL